MKSIHSILLTSISMLLLGSCAGIAPKFYEPADNELHDAKLGLNRDDYRKLPFIPPKEAPEGAAGYNGFQTIVAANPGEPPIPDLAPILAAPPVPKIGQTKLVSIAVTDDVPLKDLLLELSRLADVDIEVDAGITGGIAFRANQRPFNEVIERISDFAGLRYSMKNGVLRVERDLPYVEMYTLDFLNMERSSTSSVNVSTSVHSSGTSGGSSGSDSGSSDSDSGSSSSGSSGGGLTTGSSSSVSSSTASDFWAQFESGVVSILAYTPQMRTSEYLEPQQQTAATPAPAAPAAVDGGAPGAAATPAASPATSSAGTASASATGSAAPAASSAQYTINRQAGTLTVLATERQQRLIKEFIKKLEYNASAQVLIEAKIVEVTLDENYQAGINWSEFGSRSLQASGSFGGISPDSAANASTIQFMKNGLTGLDIDLNVAVDLVQEFGTTRTLSSPRLHAINNQQAVMTFARNQVFFNITIEREEETTTAGTDSTTYTVNTELNTVPIGIIMSLLPSVNRDTGEITLNVRPTLSRVVDEVEDPQLAIAAALDPGLGDINIQNLIPVVEVRELDSILKVKSGQVMVIGGLMEDRGIQSDNGVPGLSEVPVVGNLFKGVTRTASTSELVIFIRATLVDSNGYSHNADKNLYETFTQDPRPIKF